MQKGIDELTYWIRLDALLKRYFCNFVETDIDIMFLYIFHNDSLYLEAQ